MAYQVRLNTQVKVRHRCRNLAGTGSVSGEAANIAASLLDPDAQPSGLTVTVTEVGTTGWYDAAFTPNSLGVWTLTLTNPASPPASEATDEGAYDYSVEAVDTIAITSDGTRDLTTLTRVRERLHFDVNLTDYDVMLASLITEVSGWIQDDLGRNIGQNAYVEYLNGWDRDALWLRQGPVVSVDSVNEVSYGEDPNTPGAMLQTLTEVEAYRYVIENDAADDNTRLPGILRRVDGSLWLKGPRRYKVVYTAGLDPLPDGVVHLATTWVVFEFLNREGRWNTARVIDDGQIQLMSPSALAAEKARVLAPYRPAGAGW